ncbi:hypothetical protein A11A3_15262 [Alcanivorax hongdengensis A-11-3]|uniref:SbsA Ig-like domain-containing protein n=2 Tax=Alcanivorax hongdengensis TaxID=519051 RepID=L0WAK5_9GAMM|nr:hypothetical protein A11A3_15262 [Alcanivorax hongdengensis A-11-3]
MAGLLAACGGDAGSTSFDGSGPASLYYSYPYDGQQAVSPHAPVVLRFSGAVSADPDHYRLYQCAPQASRCDADSKVGTVALAAPQSTGEGRGLVLAPADGSLKTGTTYSLVFNDLDIDGDTISLPQGSLAFRTRVARKGPLSERLPQPALAVSQVMPAGDDQPLVDFSTVSVRFNQPLASSTVRYGDSVSLRHDGQLVPASVRMQGSALVIDPDTDLTPGADYTLAITTALQGIGGDGLDSPFEKHWVAKDTRPRSVMVQQAAAANDCDQPSAQSTSMLTGQAINCVPVIARLLGDTTVSRQSGDVFAQLAFAPHFPEVTPLRIPRGSLLKGDALKVMIGGQVDAGFDSGKVTVTFLSDATGYLIPNPYTDDPDAPRQLRLSIDVAFDTQDPRANGAFTQQLLQVELVGTAIADTDKGSLVADAVGVVEPEVLGVETAYGVLSFHMESYPDQQSAPSQPMDMTHPQLRSWQPGEQALMQRPGDPVVLNFSEPLDADSIVAGNNLRLSAGGSTVDFDWRVDGAALVLQPAQPLAYGTAYQVQFTDTITDIAGNGAMGETLSFQLPDFGGDTPRAPLVLTSYPGFPCNTVDRELDANDAGRCLGGRDGSGSSPDGAAAPVEDDHLPLGRLPVNRSIAVTFSQVMAPSSVTADTVVLEEVDSDGNPQGGPLPGQRQVSGRALTFTPDQALQPGHLYRYTLHSVPANPDCGGDALCDTRGLPLQTRLLYQQAADFPEPQQGGESLVIYFRAEPASGDVLQALRNLPSADVNANLQLDDGEALPSQTDSAEKNSAMLAKGNPSAEGQLIKDIDIGCPSQDYLVPDLSTFPALENLYGYLYQDMPSSPCPDRQYLFITGNLGADIAGYLSKDQVAERFGDDPLIPQAVKEGGGVLAYINPSRIVTSGTTVYPILTEVAKALTNAVLPAPTGPQLMRIRYSCDANPSAATPCGADDDGRVKGWIIDGDGGPQFVTRLNLYLDAPKLEPVAVVSGNAQVFTHNLHSYPLTLDLTGQVHFLDDGRLQISQISTVALPIDVYLGGLVADLVEGPDAIHMRIPAGKTVLNYISKPIKP